MTDLVFQHVLPLIPPTSNSSSSKGRNLFKKRVETWLKSLHISNNDALTQDKLYGRIFYFNHENVSVRDIHNIIKPLFDSLEGYVYKDDKQILHFEGIRLDMEHNDRWFEVELNLSTVPNLQQALTMTCCLIEVSKLPAFPSSAVKVIWL